MKVFICDHCGRHERPDSSVAEMQPIRWMTLSRNLAPYQSKHFCSPTCLKQSAMLMEEKENSDKELVNADPREREVR